MQFHTVEKIGGTSMSDYVAVRDNIILKPVHNESIYNRVFVVSAYGGITNLLLEHKKNGTSGVYAEFANSLNDDSWMEAMEKLKQEIFSINQQLFKDKKTLNKANEFIGERLDDAERVLADLQRLCQHGHFALDMHLATVREMLASIGEAHSAWNTATLLKKDKINARYVDLTGWQTDKHMKLDERIDKAFAKIDLSKELPIVTGYAHSDDGLMSTFDRGYSEMTFSRIAVLTNANEAIIHKEFHLST
ncbi:MAG TPA: aspartate kinase, partial [Methylophaga sp.]|nr:aspartate kinase [Methylophaga sp.]